MKKSHLLAMAVAGLMAVGMPLSAAQAQSAAEFYGKKQLTIYVGVSPGGIYGTFAQLLTRHIGRHIPGNPTVVTQFLRGAGGTKAVNYVYNVAPQDGSVSIAPNAGITKRVVLGIGNPKYDPTKFQWLGGWGEATNTVTIRSDVGVKSIKEATQKQVILGSIGKSSNTFMIPSLMNNTIGTKFKIISGYRGGSPIRKAIESGELNGWAGQWLGWKLRKADWIRDGKIVNLVQMASKRDPDLPNVPLLTDFARNDEERDLFTFVQTGIADKGFMVGPRVPADRATALEKAYWATLHDKKFLAAMKQRHYRIDPISRTRIQAFVESIMKTPPEKVAKLRKLMGLKKKK
jgi:tripartite-type tricarboxylate transporter receptor subunit TctC